MKYKEFEEKLRAETKTLAVFEMIKVPVWLWDNDGRYKVGDEYICTHHFFGSKEAGSMRHLGKNGNLHAGPGYFRFKEFREFPL